MSNFLNRKTIAIVALLLTPAALIALGRSLAARRAAAQQRANVGSIDSEQIVRLRQAIEQGYTSTVAAFATGAEEAEYEARDAEAKRSVEALEALLSSVRPQLAPELATSCEALLERVTSAQLQLMAFAINRKNHGLPDAAQVKAELDDRQAFQRDIEPLYQQVKAALL